MGVEEGDVGVEEGAIDCWGSEGALDPPPPPYPVYWSLNMIFLNIKNEEHELVKLRGRKRRKAEGIKKSKETKRKTKIQKKRDISRSLRQRLID